MDKIIIILAIVLGIFFRVWQIGKIPAGLGMDEAAFGYNAWSIAQTGRDEFGKWMPTIFRSFADFKLPAYVYATAVVVKIFGPGVWQTRSVSIGAGLLSCLLLYLIGKNLMNRKIGIISALIMLWSPWGIFFSRGAFEGNLGLTFLLLGIYGLVKSRENSRYLLITAIAFSIANYSYLAFKFDGAVLLIVWLIAYQKRHLFSKTVIAAVALFILLSLPSYLILTGVSGNNRIDSLLKLNPAETGYPQVIQVLSNYMTFFSPRNLFFRPDPVRQRHFETVSTFFPFMFIFYLYGLAEMFKRRKTESGKWILVGLLVGPVPAALSQDPFATLRAIGILPGYCLMLALGAENVFSIKWVNKYKEVLAVLILVIMSISLSTALLVMKGGQVAEWNGDIDELVSQLASQYPNRPVFFDVSHDVYPNIALAMKYPPQRMQIDNKYFDLTKYYSDPNFVDPVKFGNFSVGTTDRSVAQFIPGALLVVRPEDTHASEPKERGWKNAFDIKDSTGRVLFFVYAFN